ncbi:MAG: MFS transporter [Spirochaetes bacterium]|nr:MFS transporter [Spirochaetota bacterium]
MTGVTASRAAWKSLACSFLAMTITTGVSQSIVILFPELLLDFGWSRTVLSVAPALFGAIGAMGGLAIGALSGRISLPLLMSAGGALGAVSLLLCRSISALWHLYLLYGVLLALGLTLLGNVPNTIIVTGWFHEKRGMAIGVLYAGSGAGVLLFMPLIQLVIDARGWRSVYPMLAITVAALIPVVAAFQRPAVPQQAHVPPGSGSSGLLRHVKALARRRRFWFTYLQLLLGPLSSSPVTIHQATLLRDKGIAPMAIAWIVSVYGMAWMAGMLSAGLLSDRIGRERTYTIGTIGMIAGCAALLAMPMQGTGMAIVYAVLFGLGFGSRPPMDSATAADVFGGARFGSTFGVLSTALGIGQLAGPVVAGAIFDASGSYDAALIFSIAVAVAATCCIWLAAPRRGREHLPEDATPAA